MAAVQPAGVAPVRRADAGTVRLGDRDIAGLVLCGEQYGAPYDLLAAAVGVAPARLRGIVARWRAAGLAQTGRLGPGPSWCWLTPRGMERTGLPYPTAPPKLARLAHIRAVLAVRLWLSGSDAYQAGGAWWESERRLRWGSRDVPAPHVADAEIHWPSVDGCPYAGQVWAVEVELTPKTAGRTTRIMSGLLTPATRYAQVVYLCSPAARPVVTRSAEAFSPGQRARFAIRDLPAAASMPGLP
jgi:hypothetical protein